MSRTAFYRAIKLWDAQETLEKRIEAIRGVKVGRPRALSSEQEEELLRRFHIMVDTFGVVLPEFIALEAVHILREDCESGKIIEEQFVESASRCGGYDWMAGMRERHSCLRAHTDNLPTEKERIIKLQPEIYG